jgi:hypothetical protein
MYQGDIAVGQVLYFHFTTQFSGLPTSLLGTPVLSVFKDATATPCTTVLSVGAGGLVVDLNLVTGLNSVAVNTAADGTFYATGHDFSVVITTGTVGGVSAIGYKVASFSINNRTPLRPTAAGRTLVVDSAGLADANVVKVGPTGAGTAQTAGDIYASVIVAAAYALINSGLSFRGTVSAVPGANQFTIPTLIGVGAGAFADITAPYRAFVLRDAGGLKAAPQGETQNITAYVSATGVFTTTAFTDTVGIGDDIIIMHPRIAELAAIKAITDQFKFTTANQVDANALAADTVLDKANGVETGLTLRNALRLIASALAGKLSGAATATVVIKNAIADDKDRITATVDADGNRTAITTDLT